MENASLCVGSQGGFKAQGSRAHILISSLLDRRLPTPCNHLALPPSPPQIHPSITGAWVVADASLAFGGVAAKSIMAPRAAAALVGQPLDPAAVQRALAAVREEVVIAPSAPGGMVEFRQSLVSSFLFKAIVHAAHALAEDVEAYASAFPPSYASGGWGLNGRGMVWGTSLLFLGSRRALGHRCHALCPGMKCSPHPRVSCRVKYSHTHSRPRNPAHHLLAAITPYSRPPSCGLQYHSAVPEEDVVGQPYRHMAADLQVCGEAQYTDDIPPPPGTLHAALVPSTQAHARLLGVDKGPALLVPGVVGVFTAEDVPGGNDIGAVAHDEELFATVGFWILGGGRGVLGWHGRPNLAATSVLIAAAHGAARPAPPCPLIGSHSKVFLLPPTSTPQEIVPCVGHPIGVVVAETEAAARAGARAVAVRYEPLPALLDIDDAIAAGSFIEGWGHSVHSGDCALALEASDVVLEGWVKMGGQVCVCVFGGGSGGVSNVFGQV